jgi:hypothetical protein
MTTYHVAKWSATFENTRSRRVELLRWVPIPNNHDGEKYTRLVSGKNGAIIFAAWILILQVASKCQPRGTLIRSDGSPLDAEALATKTRAPVSWFTTALPYLVKIGWMLTEIQEQTQLPLGGHAEGTAGAPEGPAGGQEEKEGKGIEGKRTAEAGFVSEIPFDLRTPEFQAAWTDWMCYRKERKLSPYTPTGVKGTFSKLVRMGAEGATISIRESIANNWQGLFEPKGNRNGNTRKGNSRGFEQSQSYEHVVNKL